MFNKKPRRNFRARKCNSSDEEDNQKHSGDEEEKEKGPVVVHKASNLAQGRGISCSSKREATRLKTDSSEEDAETLGDKEVVEERKNDKEGTKKTTNTALSFSEDKEGTTVTLPKGKSHRHML